MRARSYAIFSDHAYQDLPDADVPDEDDRSGAHWPWPLKRNPNLERFTSLSSVQGDLRTELHGQLLQRIVELCTPEDQAPDDEAKT